MALARRILLVAVSALLIAVGVVFGVRIALPAPPPPDVQPVTPHRPARTEQLVLIVIDGVRYDFATDPAVMPQFARWMAEHSSSLVWAGRVTMTSPAIIAWTAGRRSSLDEIVNNETAKPAVFNNLLANAKQAGLVTAATGDTAWFQLFPGLWDLSHPDPPGVAMEVDYNDEIFAALATFVRQRPRPQLVVAHFVTPDHQGHVHGIYSEAYRRHLRGVDDKLASLLASLPADATVFVTSDHGQAATGTHGWDEEELRRTPMFAYGPGIRKGWHPVDRIEQIDLPATFAHLLGIASPAHSEGHVLARWLDASDTERAAVACEELDRLRRYAAVAMGSPAAGDEVMAAACGAPDPEQRLERARQGSGRLAELIEGARPAESGDKWILLALTALGAIVIGVGWSGRPWRERLRAWWPSLLGAGLLGAVAVLVTWGLERFPRQWALYGRIGLTVAANVALAAVVVLLPRFARWLDRHRPLAATLAVGALVASYTKYTQAETFIVVATTGAVLLLPWPRRWLRLEVPGTGRLPLARALVALLLIAWLAPLAFQRSDMLPAWVVRTPGTLRTAAVAALVAFGVERCWRRRSELGAAGPWALTLASLLAPIAALWLRSAGLGALAVGAWIGLAALGLGLWRRGRRLAAEQLWLASYGMVSRDGELLYLLPTIFIAEVLGELAGTLLARGSPGSKRPRHAVVVGLVTLLFSLTYVQRIGVQLSLDFPGFDWVAGTFGDAGVSLWRIGAAITYKHAFARAAVLLVFLLPLTDSYRRAAVHGLLLVELGRTVVVFAVLLTCRWSFWTAMRALGDLPHGFIAVAVATLACAVVLRPTKRRRGEPAAGSAAGRARPGAAPA